MNSHYPADHTLVTTYEDLARYARAFAKGHLSFLLLLGPPGVGKSQAFRAALPEGAGWLSGNLSPLGLYLEAFRHRDQPLVLDDIDGLHRNVHFVQLLKNLCETTAVKRLAWHTETHALKEHDVPATFETRSKLALIANDWASVSPDVRALEDRAEVLVFAPPPAAIHAYATTWFHDQEIAAFIAAQLPLLPELSLRLYTKALERKQAGFDWRELVLSRIDPTLRAVSLLRADPHYPNEAARVQAFIAAGHGSRAKYYRLARQLPA